MTYRQKLEDPRWQKLRLKIFERDGFKCVSCDDGSKPLHVHHLKYHPEPWEARPDELSTLCEDCHDNLEAAIRMLREHPQITALPHLVNRAVMLHEKDLLLPFRLLGHSLKLCGETTTDNALQPLLA